MGYLDNKGTRTFPVYAKPCTTHTVAKETRHQSLKGYEPKDVKLRASVKKTNNVHNFKNLQIGKLTTPAWWTRKKSTRTILEAIGQ